MLNRKVQFGGNALLTCHRLAMPRNVAKTSGYDKCWKNDKRPPLSFGRLWRFYSWHQRWLATTASDSARRLRGASRHLPHNCSKQSRCWASGKRMTAVSHCQTTGVEFRGLGIRNNELRKKKLLLATVCSWERSKNIRKMMASWEKRSLSTHEKCI